MSSTPETGRHFMPSEGMTIRNHDEFVTVTVTNENRAIYWEFMGDNGFIPRATSHDSVEEDEAQHTFLLRLKTPEDAKAYTEHIGKCLDSIVLLQTIVALADEEHSRAYDA
jgi:hypothetical protein